MYKTKLQEVCHKKRWDLPKYTSMKCGPDHSPRFAASVSVNGISFDSLSPCKSSKEAHNHAAMFAFLHFTSPASLSGSEPAAVTGPITEEICQNLDVHSNVSGVRNDSSAAIIKSNNLEPNIKEAYQSLKTHPDTLDAIDDIHCQYKNLLQKYAQQRSLELPMYYSEHVGSHASSFKAKVTVGEQIFETPELFDTSKEAESAAAKAALVPFLVGSFQKLSEREGFGIPVYETTKFGALHNPIFFSSMEVDREIFNRQVAKSKKQAKLDAARVGYVSLKQRNSFIPKTQSPKYTPSPVVGMACNSLQSLEHETQVVPFHAQIDVKHVEETNENSADIIIGDAILISKEDSRSSPKMKMKIMNRNEKKQFESATSFSPRDHHDHKGLVSHTSTKESNKYATSYLLCNKVRVYQKLPNFPFPDGIIVLPISHEKWVAISLDFPNEENNMPYE